MPPIRATAAMFPGQAARRLRPPADLVGPARDVLASVPAEHFHNSDLPVLCIFARACAQEKAASDVLADEGYVTADGKPHAMLTVLRDAQRVVANYSRLLRLNPIARTPMPTRMPRDVEPQSYYERMQQEAEGDERAN